MRRFAWVVVLALVAAVVTGGCTVDTKKIAIGVAAYVHPGDDLFKLLHDPTVEPPEWVIVNLANGDGDMSSLDATADYLHLRRTAAGRPIKVLGYVWTSDINKRDEHGNYDFSNRPEADIKRSIDSWLVRPDGVVHYDGIFFDVASPICAHRDKFLRLKEHVKSRWSIATIVHNAGVAVHDCYLEPGKRTADIFATFEGPEHVYYNEDSKNGYGYWLGGNVSSRGQYVLGDKLTFVIDGVEQQVNISRDSYWHLLYASTIGNEERTVDLARARYAGVLTSSTAGLPNPWQLGNRGADHLRAVQKYAEATTAGEPAPTTTVEPRF